MTNSDKEHIHKLLEYFRFKLLHHAEDTENERRYAHGKSSSGDEAVMFVEPIQASQTTVMRDIMAELNEFKGQIEKEMDYSELVSFDYVLLKVEAKCNQWRSIMALRNQ